MSDDEPRDRSRTRGWLAVVATVVLAACASVATPAASGASASAAVATASTPLTVPPASSSGPSAVRGQRFSMPVFVSEQVGWIPTFDDRIFRTTGGGWRETRVPGATFLAGLDFVGTAVGWTIAISPDPSCGQQALIRTDLECRATLLSTADGGDSWTARSAFTSHRSLIPLRGLRAASAQAVWAIHEIDCAPTASCPDEVVITEDGGQTWRSTLNEARVFDLLAASATEAWAVVSVADPANSYSTSYRVRHTTDGGRTWRDTLSAVNFAYATRSARSLWILERDGGYCTASNCSSYVLRYSSDAGETWSSLGNPKVAATCTGGHLGAPTFSGRDLRTGYIPISLGAGGVRVGDGGLLETHDAGRTWSCATTPPNVSAALAVMGIVVAISDDRLTNTDTVWVRSGSGPWSIVLR